MYPNTYFCVVSDDKEIWIKADKYENVANAKTDYNVLKDAYVDITPFEKTNENLSNTSSSNDDNSNELKRRSVDNTLESNLIYCVIGGILVAIIAIIVIIIINKNKKIGNK